MIQSNNCIIHANCPLLPSIVPTAFSELLPRKWKKKKIDNPLYFQEIIFAWLVLVIAFQSTEESLLWNYFCLICVGVVAFQSIEESLHEIFCSFSNSWDHFIMKAEKLILVVGCHTNYTDCRKFVNYLKQLWKSWFQMNFFKIKIFMAIWN